MPDFRHRSGETELMDQGGLSFAEFHHCLQSLETINQLTLAYRPTLRWLRSRARTGEKLTILDAGSGGGDMLRRVERQARHWNQSVNLMGIDLNPWSKKSAQTCSPASSIRFITGDIFSFEPDRPIDVIICSLFTHHLDDDQLVGFLRWLDRRARKGWFINDLHRHPLPYYFIKYTTGLFSRNRLIRNDAAVSVARSFKKSEWRQLLDRAGIGESARVERHFPYRLCVSREKAEVSHDS